MSESLKLETGNYVRIGKKGRQACKPIANSNTEGEDTWHDTKTQYAAFAAARA